MTAKFDNSRIITRLFAKGSFRLESAAHFGGGEPGSADMTLLLDADNTPLIPGSSIAGAGRTWLARRLHPWSEFIQGEQAWKSLKLFGYLANGNKTKSPLRVHNALAVGPQQNIALRDGIRLDGRSGTTADTAKFDFEVVEPGVEFALFLDCIIRENDPQEEIIDQFHALLHGFENGEIALGGRTSRGLGQGRVNMWDVSQLSMQEKSHILAWLRHNPYKVTLSRPTHNSIPDKRCFIKVEASFSLNHSLLVRQECIDNSLPDVMQFLSGGKPIVPGTSIAGVLRARVEFIARTLWGNEEDNVKTTIDEMFGPLHTRDEAQSSLYRSRVVVHESIVEGCTPKNQERVAIDRFTGGSLPHAKFNEQPLVAEDKKEHLQLTITLENPRNHEIGLLLLAVKDLWFGRANLGGEGSLGRGLLTGHNAKITLRKEDGHEQVWMLNGALSSSLLVCTDENSKKELDEFVGAAKKPPTINDNLSRNPKFHNIAPKPDCKDGAK